MSGPDILLEPKDGNTAGGVIKLVIMAVGGQGGGVLTNWIESVARHAGRAVQATSVAGVAQRTGATIYYLEIAPEGVKQPIFSLAPASGDVDILIAAEWMEAGRAIQRGFVTPDRTTLIASTHRMLAVSEKIVPGNGIAEGDDVAAAVRIAAKRRFCADMERLAQDQGSVISASLFGALAGADVLPFSRTAFEEAIRSSGKGVDASLKAFAAGYDAVSAPINAPRNEVSDEETASQPTLTVKGSPALQKDWVRLIERVQQMPAACQDLVTRGLQKVVSFQDITYGTEYLDHVESFSSHDGVMEAAAKYIANAMAYDDVIGVADNKTRGSRRTRIDAEMQTSGEQVLHLTEFFHPRAEELVGLLPARLGERIASSQAWMDRIDRWFCKGRRPRSDRLRGFLLLYCVAGLRRWRRGTYRHRLEQKHLESWLSNAHGYLDQNPDLAGEVLRAHRLIKGYSDTHARGQTKFDKVIAGINSISDRDDAADWARRLIEAALKDPEGKALDGALQTIESFSDT